jgi:hypothetical protein
MKTSSKTTTKSNLRSKQIFIYLVTALLVVQSATMIFLLLRTSNLEHDRTNVTTQINRLAADIDGDNSLQHPVVMAKEKLIAFPEIGITLPYNDVTKTFLYTYDGENVRVTSTMLNDHKQRQMSCAELVRISMRSGTPYSPWEETANAVALPDGRTMHTIAAKAFKNNEASTLACASEVWIQTNPQQVADEFKKAQLL